MLGCQTGGSARNFVFGLSCPVFQKIGPRSFTSITFRQIMEPPMRPPNHGGGPRISRNTSILKGLGPVFDQKPIFSMVLTSHGLFCGKSTLLGKGGLEASKSTFSVKSWGPPHGFGAKWRVSGKRGSIEKSGPRSFKIAPKSAPLGSPHGFEDSWGGYPMISRNGVELKLLGPLFHTKPFENLVASTGMFHFPSVYLPPPP